MDATREKQVDIVADTYGRLNELHIRAGQVLCHWADRARILEDIAVNSRTPHTKRWFTRQARRAIFIADCWRTQFDIANRQTDEFLRIRQAVNDHLKAEGSAVVGLAENPHRG